MLATHSKRDGLVIDGDCYEWLPRTRQFAGKTVYLIDGSLPDVIAAYAKSGDELGGPNPGAVGSIRVHCGKNGSYVIRGGDAWGLPRDVDGASRKLAALRDAVAEENLPWRATASSVSGFLGRRVMPDLGKRGTRLGDRWEGLWRAAMHPGPCVALRGSMADAIQVDRVAAYLHAMDGAAIGTLWREGGQDWRRIRWMHGAVTACVRVPSALPVGPLPARVWGSVAWPVGTFVGTWPIVWLTMAEDIFGVEVLSVGDAVVAIDTDSMSPLFDAFSNVASKDLRKLLYTRWWARWSSPGWYSAVLDENAYLRRPLDAAGEAVYLGKDFETYGRMERATGARWLWRPPEQQPRERRRPDIAATVCGNAAWPVARFLAGNGYDCALAHVDAVWVSGDAACIPRATPKGWSIKSEGPLRVYGVGCYDHNGHMGSQGCPPRHQGSPEAMRAWMERHGGRGTLSTREWTTNPAKDPEAMSAPLEMGVPPEGVDVGYRPTWAADADNGPWLYRESGWVGREEGRPWLLKNRADYLDI